MVDERHLALSYYLTLSTQGWRALSLILLAAFMMIAVILVRWRKELEAQAPTYHFDSLKELHQAFLKSAKR